MLKPGFGFCGPFSMDVQADDPPMLQALKLSILGKSTPNPCVGAVLVDQNNTLVDFAFTEESGGLHAERKLLQKNITQQNLDLYVTLEPCTHQGQQPACTEMIRQKIESGLIRHVYFATKDPNPSVRQSDLKDLPLRHDHQFEKELHTYFLPFKKWILTQKPWVGIKWAQSIDGSLANAQGKSKWITSPKIKDYTFRLRHHYDAIVVGLPTWANDQPQLNVRIPDAQFQPTKILIDFENKLEEVAQSPSLKNNLIAQFSHSKAFVVRTQPLHGDLEKSIQVYQTDSVLDLADLWARLSTDNPTQKRIQSFLIEGGPTFINHVLASRSVDIIHQYIAPKFLGKSRFSVSLACDDLSQNDYSLLTLAHFDNDVLIEWIRNHDYC